MSKWDKELQNGFGNYIKYNRDIKELSLKDLSQKSKISVAYLSRLENNRKNNPSLLILKKLAEGLNISVMSLLEVYLNLEEKKIKTLKEVLIDTSYSVGNRELNIEERKLMIDVIELIINNKIKIDELELVYKVRLLRKMI